MVDYGQEIVNQSFHYNCIKVIARYAGLSPDDSQVIAYVSQYVDDATEHKGIKINGVPDIAKHLIDINGLFQPVCTAHKGIQFIDSGPDVQNKVYIPFHYMPASINNYVVQTPGEISVQLIKKAIDKFDQEDRLHSLIRLGIVLHTYADTWAHNNFSGRHNSHENDIENIKIYNGVDWNKIDTLEQLGLNILPAIGHAEAASYPDVPYCVWKYKHAHSKTEMVCNNPSIFVASAQSIYNILTMVSSGQLLEFPYSKLLQCFSSKKNRWKALFPEIRFDYNNLQWRRDSLSGMHCNWDSYKHPEEFMQVFYNATDDMKWFVFHVMAKEQRMHLLKVFT